MVPRENKNNAYAKFGGTNKEYNGIFRSGLLLENLKCYYDKKKNNSSFSLDFTTTLTNHYVTQVLSLDFEKTPVYFNWDFPI